MAERNRFVGGVKTVVIEGYNFGSSIADVKYVEVKGQNCSYVEMRSESSSSSLLCWLTHLSSHEKVEANDVTLATDTSTSTGIHLQPLTIARGRSRRAVMSRITTTTLPFTPYSVAYPLPLNGLPPAASDKAFVYWADIGAGRLYRCLTNGKKLEVLLEHVRFLLNFFASRIDILYCDLSGLSGIWSGGGACGGRDGEA